MADSPAPISHAATTSEGVGYSPGSGLYGTLAFIMVVLLAGLYWGTGSSSTNAAFALPPRCRKPTRRGALVYIYTATADICLQQESVQDRVYPSIGVTSGAGRRPLGVSTPPTATTLLAGVAFPTSTKRNRHTYVIFPAFEIGIYRC